MCCGWLFVGLGWSLLAGLVRSVLVVVALVFGEDVSGVCLVVDQYVVTDLGAKGSDDPFAVCVHPRRLGRAGQDVHLFGSEDVIER